MAALDFPANPTNGQSYGNWLYSTAKGAWQAKPITGKVTTSAVAPSAPANGDEWFNTNDGNLYVYYTDVDGSQWVQVKSDATLSSTLGNRVTTLETYPSGLVPIVPTSVTVSSGSATTGTNGLVTFNASLSASLNGVFSSAFKNYKVLVKLSPSSGSYGGSMYLKLRTAGTDYSLNYYYGGTYVSSGTMNLVNASGASLTIGVLPDDGTAERFSSSIEIFAPYEAKATGYNSVSGTVYAGNNYNMNHSGANISTNSFDGLSLIPGGSGNITGTVQVYGLR